MYLMPHTHIVFEGNHADYVGGAIYTDYRKPEDPCFFHVDSQALSNTVKVSFVNNTADFAGSSLYGGIFSCCTGSACKPSFYDVFNTSNTETDPSAMLRTLMMYAYVRMESISLIVLMKTKFSALMPFEVRISISSLRLSVASMMVLCLGLFELTSIILTMPRWGYRNTLRLVTGLSAKI